MITLAYWQLAALLVLASFICFLLGVGTMAWFAMAGYSDEIRSEEE